jgi:hypothetical protein
MGPVLRQNFLTFNSTVRRKIKVITTQNHRRLRLAHESNWEHKKQEVRDGKGRRSKHGESRV